MTACCLRSTFDPQRWEYPPPARTAVARRDRYCRCVTDPHKWVVHDERVVDDTPHVRVSLADVELPDGVRFTQYVFKMRRAAITVVLDDAGERVLMMRRHRFIVDRWVWELPGGYVDDGEDPADAAAREVEEETGWRPRRMEYVLSCQPMIGNADYPQDLYLAHGAELTDPSVLNPGHYFVGTPDDILAAITESQRRLGYEELIFWARPPGMPIEHSTASLELIARHVLPALREGAVP